MLKLVNIIKDYPLDNINSVHALKGISLDFKEDEFVSILGPSGCGKTTLLNIIGGLDRYTNGDLLVDGVSTKNFRDRDWDNYRNKRIGIVFQSYNLIPHLSVLANVELGMTLSGTSIKVRKERAIEALTKVGLSEEINKKPNQLSGGQMQRVAIARAIVNNPGIILADEPTGALDSKTSVQVMDILKDLANDHLVIMVTHNQELAKKYSTRLITISDGTLIDDKEIEKNKKVVKDEKKEVSSDYTMISPTYKEEVEEGLKNKKKKKEKTSMSFFTALNISANNLRTKKGRTIMTAIAGSIGIIGVALVLAVSSGFSNYISNMQSETLAQFPISIEEYGLSSSSVSSITEENNQTKYPDDKNINVKEPMSSSLHVNDLSSSYIEYLDKIDTSLTSGVQYNHSIQMNIMTKSEDSGDIKYFSTSQSSLLESLTSSGYWAQLPGDASFILSQYDLIEGSYPSGTNDVVLVVDRYNNILSSTLSSLGFDKYDLENDKKTISFSSILNHKFKVIPNDDFYTSHANSNASQSPARGIFLKPQYDLDKSGLKLSKLTEYFSLLSSAQKEGNMNDILLYASKVFSYLEIPEGVDFSFDDLTAENFATKLASLYQEKSLEYYTVPSEEDKENIYNSSTIGTDLKVTGIIRPKSTTMTPLLSSGIYYTSSLTDYVIEKNSPSVSDLNNNGKIDPEEDKRCAIAKSYEKNAYIGLDSLIHTRSIINANTETNNFSNYIKQRKMIGTENYISSISIYPKDFSSKKKILTYLDKYNEDKEESNKVIYTDLASTITSGIGSMVDIISYVLIAFASISLVVSSVMIGIITYTSVIERTKEIGILRSVGARKKDVGRLFKAEAVIIGFLSGVVGVILSYIICIPINITLNAIYPEYNIGNIAALNPLHAVLLILLSSLLTYIASVLPSRIAAKKDPVIALRSE